MTELRTVEQIATLGARVRREEMDSVLRISSSLQRHVDWLSRDLERFDALYVHEVGANQRRFIDAFGTHVLPALRRR